MTYRDNDRIESGEDEHLKHIRELCMAKIQANDDLNAIQLARDVLAKLPEVPQFTNAPAPSATGRDQITFPEPTSLPFNLGGNANGPKPAFTGNSAAPPADDTGKGQQ